MATDINQEVSNMYNAAKQALTDDLKQNYYNANANHVLYSGVPAATQMQYDAQTFIPNIATMAQQAIQKQQENQETWDKYMSYVKELDEQANYYNNLANNLNSQSSELEAKYQQYARYAGNTENV